MRLILFCFLTLLSGVAAAAELRGGVVRQDFQDLWAAPAKQERAWGLNAEWGFDPLGRLLGGDVAPFVGATWTPARGKVDKAYAGISLEWNLEPAILRLGLGGVVHNGKVDDPATNGIRRQFGSRVLFHIPVELGLAVAPGTRLSLYFDHMSNAGLARLNPGMDSLGIRIGWRL